MRHHHGGSGRAVVMPDDWAAVHAPVVEGLMTEATVSIRKPGGTSSWSTADKKTETVDFPAFATDLPARILALTEGRVSPDNAVDDQVRVIGYRVSLPRFSAYADLKPGALVTVQTCDGDPMLVGRVLEVSDVVRGTHLFERDLIATLND